MLVLPAELTHVQAGACRRMLEQALSAEAAAHCVVDASALERFDSSALAVLLAVRREAAALGRSFAVSGASGKLRSLAGLYGVAELLPEATAS